MQATLKIARAFSKYTFIGDRLGFGSNSKARRISHKEPGRGRNNSLSRNLPGPDYQAASLCISCRIFLFLSFFGRAQLDLSSSKSIWIFAIIMLIVVIVSKFNDNSSFIVLYADRIEKKSWFDTKVWRRDEVANLSLHSFGKFCLVRKYNKGDYFFIPAGIERDPTWNDWLRDVPELSKYSGIIGEKKFAAGVVYIGFGILALLMAFLSFISFRDSSIVEHGMSIWAKVLTVQNGKNTASGWVDYRLPNGTACHNWTELAPKGSIRPGEYIIVAVDRTCGHPVSKRNALHPWLYLSATIGIILAMAYQLRKLKNGSTVEGRIA